MFASRSVSTSIFPCKTIGGAFFQLMNFPVGAPCVSLQSCDHCRCWKFSLISSESSNLMTSVNDYTPAFRKKKTIHTSLASWILDTVNIHNTSPCFPVIRWCIFFWGSKGIFNFHSLESVEGFHWPAPCCLHWWGNSQAAWQPEEVNPRGSEIGVFPQVRGKNSEISCDSHGFFQNLFKQKR